MFEIVGLLVGVEAGMGELDPGPLGGGVSVDSLAAYAPVCFPAALFEEVFFAPLSVRRGVDAKRSASLQLVRRVST